MKIFLFKWFNSYIICKKYNIYGESLKKTVEWTLQNQNWKNKQNIRNKVLVI